MTIHLCNQMAVPLQAWQNKQQELTKVITNISITQERKRKKEKNKTKMAGICLSCKTFKYRLNTSLYLKKFASLHSQVKEFLSLVFQLFSLNGLVRLLHVDGCFVILELILGCFRLVQRKQERKTVVSFTTYGFLSSH